MADSFTQPYRSTRGIPVALGEQLGLRGILYGANAGHVVSEAMGTRRKGYAGYRVASVRGLQFLRAGRWLTTSPAVLDP